MKLQGSIFLLYATRFSIMRSLVKRLGMGLPNNLLPEFPAITGSLIEKRSICTDDGAPSRGTIVGEDTEAASGIPPRRAASSGDFGYWLLQSQGRGTRQRYTVVWVMRKTPSPRPRPVPLERVRRCEGHPPGRCIRTMLKIENYISATSSRPLCTSD
jgi:hypothetical protein